MVDDIQMYELPELHLSTHSASRLDPADENGSFVTSLSVEIAQLETLLARLHSELFLLQEFRHSKNEGIADGGYYTNEDEDSTNVSTTLLSQFEAHLETFSNRLTFVKSLRDRRPLAIKGQNATSIQFKEVNTVWSEIYLGWSDLLQAQELLKKELREDQWMIVLYSTSIQATDMMDSLQRVLRQCKALLDPVNQRPHSAYIVAAEAALRDYQDKKRFYQPSIIKAIALLGQGIQDRLTQNGEALMMYAAQSQRWERLRVESLLFDKEIPYLHQQYAIARIRNDIAGNGEDGSRQKTTGGSAPPSAFSVRKTYERELTNATGNRARSNSVSSPSKGYGISRSETILQQFDDGSGRVSWRNAPVSIGSVLSDRSDCKADPFTDDSHRRRMAARRDSYGHGDQMLHAKSGIEQVQQRQDDSARPRIRSRSVSNNTSIRTNTRRAGPSLTYTPTEVFGQSGMFTRQTSIPTPQFNSTGVLTPRGASGSRPATPSSLPRPTSRLSMSGRERASEPVSPAANGTSEMVRSFIPVGRASPSPYSGRRSASGPIYRTHEPPPPVPALPSRQELQAKEDLRAAFILSTSQTSVASLRTGVTNVPFGVGSRSVSMTTPRKVPFGTVSETLSSRSPSRMHCPPSSFKSPMLNLSRPSSSLSTRSRSMTPYPASQGGFIPNHLDELDKEMARLLDNIPNDIQLQVERVDPPLRKGQLHGGEWKAQYAFTTGSGNRKIHSCRLIELTRSGTNVENKARKVMIRDKGVWIDLRLFISSAE